MAFATSRQPTKIKNELQMSIKHSFELQMKCLQTTKHSFELQIKFII